MIFYGWMFNPKFSPVLWLDENDFWSKDADKNYVRGFEDERLPAGIINFLTNDERSESLRGVTRIKFNRGVLLSFGQLGVTRGKKIPRTTTPAAH